MTPQGHRAFPATRPSLIDALGDADADRRRDASDLFARAYWAPVASVLRARWRFEPDDVDDLTQDFFGELFAKDWLLKYDPARARFRTFVRMCLDRFVANAVQSSRRLKRGGGARPVTLDDALLAAPDAEMDEQFRQEWVKSVFTMALGALRAEAEDERKADSVAIFEAYDVEDAPDGERPSYADLARRFGVPETTITNRLAWARRAFRHHVLETLRSLAGSETEFREDARDLLGVTPP